MLEDIVVDQIRRLLVRPEWAVRIAKNTEKLTQRSIIASLQKFEALWDELFPAEQMRILNLLVEKITVYPDKLLMTLLPLGMVSLLHELMSDIVHIVPHADTETPSLPRLSPFQFRWLSKNVQAESISPHQTGAMSLPPEHRALTAV